MFQLIFHPSVSNDFREKVHGFVDEWNDNQPIIQAKTSGSTGKSKQIALLKNQMRASAKMTRGFFSPKPLKKLFLCLSPDYIAGKMMIVRAIEWGADLYVIEPKTSFPIFGERLKVDFAAMMPYQLEAYISEIANQNFHIETLLIGGMAVSTNLEEKIREHQLNVFLSFGMTETTSHIALKSLSEENKPYEAVGKTTFSVNENEQLVIQAPDLGIESLITNDAVDLLSPSSFHWKGRVDNVINSGGIKFYAEELENKLQKVIETRFFIFAEKHETYGDAVAICLESNENQIDKESVRMLLPQYAFPKKWYFSSKFAETSNGKIDRTTTLKQLQGAKK